MSKYAQTQTNGQINAMDAERFRQIVDLVSPQFLGTTHHRHWLRDGRTARRIQAARLPKPDRIRSLAGLRQTARRLYNIEVKQRTIRNLDTVVDRFDLVILTGVLEHLADIDSSLESLIRLLKPEGHLYFEVPDASSYYAWFSAPFQFFSMEHVNFFSPKSLSNLLVRHGFLNAGSSSASNAFSVPTAVEPQSPVFFRRTKKNAAIDFDDETEPACRDILKFATNGTAHPRRHCRLVERQVPLAVWVPAHIPCDC